MYSSWTKIENPTKKDLLHGLLGTKEKSRKIAYLRFKNSKLPQAVVSKQRVDRWRILMIGDAFWTIRCRGRKPLQKVPIVLSSSLKGEVLFQSAVHEANNRTRRVDACFFSFWLPRFINKRGKNGFASKLSLQAHRKNRVKNRRAQRSARTRTQHCWHVVLWLPNSVRQPPKQLPFQTLKIWEVTIKKIVCDRKWYALKDAALRSNTFDPSLEQYVQAWFTHTKFMCLRGLVCGEIQNRRQKLWTKQRCIRKRMRMKRHYQLMSWEGLKVSRHCLRWASWPIDYEEMNESLERPQRFLQLLHTRDQWLVVI